MWGKAARARAYEHERESTHLLCAGGARCTHQILDLLLHWGWLVWGVTERDADVSQRSRGRVAKQSAPSGPPCPALLACAQEKASPAHVLACLELLTVLAPGSESHTAVALKYDGLVRQKAHLLEALIKQVTRGS